LALDTFEVASWRRPTFRSLGAPKAFFSVTNRPQTVRNVPEVRIVMLLIPLPDFLMHGVVLQSRAFRPRWPDVSRETSLRKNPPTPFLTPPPAWP
jgi:hypothetical protein